MTHSSLREVILEEVRGPMKEAAQRGMLEESGLDWDWYARAHGWSDAKIGEAHTALAWHRERVAGVNWSTLTPCGMRSSSVETVPSVELWPTEEGTL